ncbi:hypothetical protein ACH4ZX_27505 [Streptomyces sp. NPDC020490]|uniref:hypothetical protein n=1 Tax=Streptomyces sp. NPDC020490 TaxID=3365078 RepID=UPI00378A35B7
MSGAPGTPPASPLTGPGGAPAGLTGPGGAPAGLTGPGGAPAGLTGPGRAPAGLTARRAERLARTDPAERCPATPFSRTPT